MVYNYANYINIFYDKELLFLVLNYSKLNVFILKHYGLYIKCVTVCFNIFEVYYIFHIFLHIQTFFLKS